MSEIEGDLAPVVSLDAFRLKKVDSGRDTPKDDWRIWYEALGKTADAASGWALSYGQLPRQAREDLLSLIETDMRTIEEISAPQVYGPLLAVETDHDLLRLIHTRLGDELKSLATEDPTTLAGTAEDGSRLGVLVVPMYPPLVRVVTCRYDMKRGIEIIGDTWELQTHAPREGSIVEQTPLAACSTAVLIDEVAAAIVAHRNIYGQPPAGVRSLAALFADPVLAVPDRGCAERFTGGTLAIEQHTNGRDNQDRTTRRSGHPRLISSAKMTNGTDE